MFFPILNYDDGYGWTYGGQTAIVDALGKGTRVSVPLSWGGTRRAAIEADRTFKTGPLTRLTGSFGITQRENPHFEVDDRRTELDGPAPSGGCSTWLTLGGELGRTDVRFLPARTRASGRPAPTPRSTRGATRRFPRTRSSPASRGAGSIRSASRRSAAAIDRYRFDARGFKRLVRAERDRRPCRVRHGVGAAAAIRAMAARRLEPARASSPGPSPATSGCSGRPSCACRSRRRSASAASASTSSWTAARSRLSARRISDAPLHKSGGAGFFLIAAVLQLNFEVSHSIDGKSTRFHFGTGFSF